MQASEQMPGYKYESFVSARLEAVWKKKQFTHVLYELLQEKFLVELMPSSLTVVWISS